MMDGGVTSLIYANFLKELSSMSGSKGLSIFHDNCPIHKSKLVRATSDLNAIYLNCSAPLRQKVMLSNMHLLI